MKRVRPFSRRLRVRSDDGWEPPGWDPDHWHQVYQLWHQGRPIAERVAHIRAWCRRLPVKNSGGRV